MWSYTYVGPHVIGPSAAIGYCVKCFLPFLVCQLLKYKKFGSRSCFWYMVFSKDVNDRIFAQDFSSPGASRSSGLLFLRVIGIGFYSSCFRIFFFLRTSSSSGRTLDVDVQEVGFVEESLDDDNNG